MKRKKDSRGKKYVSLFFLSDLFLPFAHAATATSSAAPLTRAYARKRDDEGCPAETEEGEAGVGARTSRDVAASFFFSFFPTLLTGAGGSFLPEEEEEEALSSPPLPKRARVC